MNQFNTVSMPMSNLWKALPGAAILAIIAAWLLIPSAIENERQSLLAAMRARAESMSWAVEGAARIYKNDHWNGFSHILEEIGRQPGVAWIAIVDGSGHVMADSNTQIEGSLIYTPAELARMDIEGAMKGRFSPDDPDIYETWKLFRPARLKRHRHMAQSSVAEQPCYILIALDATGLHKSLETLRNRLLLIASLLVVAMLCAIALAFFIYSYRVSRRRLADTQAFATQVLKSYPAALIVTDTAGKISFCNQLALKMFDIARVPQQLAEMPYLDWKSLLKQALAGEPILDREENLLLNNGAQLPVTLSIAPIRDGHNNILGNLFIFLDIGEIKLLKQKLAQSHHLSSIGKLAAGVAHEIRNPLSAICGYAHYLEKKLDSDPMGQATAHLLLDEAQRLNSVLSDLLSFARPAGLNLKKQPLDAILRKAYLLARPDAEAKNVALELHLSVNGANLPMPEVDADKLMQAVLNLVLNALQATDEGGKVFLELELAPRDGKDDTPHWRIIVRDTGKGMEENILKQVFNPYFTTRASGVGLGLAISRQIVERHGGAISAASVPGRGSAFTIILPAA